MILGPADWLQKKGPIDTSKVGNGLLLPTSNGNNFSNKIVPKKATE